MENEFKINLYEIMGTSTPAGRTSEDGDPAGDTIRNLLAEMWENEKYIKFYIAGGWIFWDCYE